MNKYKLSEYEVFQYRPKPFYFITTHDPADLTYEMMLEKLRELKEQGFGGIVLFNKPQNGFDKDLYLGELWFQMIQNTAEACRTLNLEMWINDGFDFPPGAVAGRIEKIAPELCQRHIKLIDGEVRVLTADWGFPAFEEPRSTELFIEMVYEQYNKKVGQYFGNPIKGFFSDSDNRRVPPPTMFNEDHPARDFFPWSSTFEQTFEAEYGYDITPFLKQILNRENIPQAVDYWKHAGNLYQRWFEAHHKWLNAHGLEYTGHTSDSSPYLYRETPRSSVLTEGRFWEVESQFDFPGTDQELYAIDGGKHMKRESYYTPRVIWGEREYMPKMENFSDISHDLRAKQASATAFMFNRKGVMCEMFAATNNGVEPQVLSQIAAFQIMQGVTFVVPHACHHRLHTDTKFFAPPVFSKGTMTDHYIRELNTEIAERTCMMSKGKPIYPIALIDPSENIWRNQFNSEEYFDAFMRLNRMPYGFTICNCEKLISVDYGFRAAVLAGFELSDDLREAIEARGIPVVNYADLERIGDYVPSCSVKYAGEGTPHFMRRIIDGEEFTFISNIEQTEPIRGILTAYNREINVCMYPGDIFYLSKNYDNVMSDSAGGEIYTELPDSVEVIYEKKNIIPIEYFTCNNKAVTAMTNDEHLTFEFTVKSILKDTSLLVPKCCDNIITSIALDGCSLSWIDGKIFDESYKRFLITELSIGVHKIEIQKNAPLRDFDRIVLEGDFDVDVKTDCKEHAVVRDCYNISSYIPSHASIVLSQRRTSLCTSQSWADQGQPFYSGGVTYTMKIEVDTAGEYRLVLPQVRDVVDLMVNSDYVAHIIKPPYSFAITLTTGINDIKITVYNSMANELDCYRENSGLLSGGKIIRI